MESNCFNLQYLALLLQNFETLFVGMSDVKKRLSVFIVPIEGIDCPYIKVNESNVEMLANDEIYKRTSHYLRLLSKEYAGIIYSAKLSGKRLNICPLDYSISPRTDEFFPVLIIEEEEYKCVFEKSLRRDFLEELFSLQKNRRFRRAASSNPHEALCDYIAETAMRRLQKNIESESVREEIKRILLKKEGINLIELSVFSFILKIKGEDSFEQDITYTWENTNNLCAGIRQLVQNSIQHSEKRKCIFSFLLKKEKDVESLFLTVSDLNFKQSMLENFIENLSWEYENIEDKSILYAHKMIIDKKEQISLRNLFGEFKESDNLDMWKLFRQQDISAHVGLLLFIMTAERCNASIVVRSSTDYRSDNNKTLYSWNYEACDMCSREEMVVPGTQFVISIPLLPLKKSNVKGLGQLKLKDEIQENYQSFAECLRYETKEIECLELLKNNINTLNDNFRITDPKDKFHLVQRWRAIWGEIIKQHIEKIDKEKYRSTISYLDMEIFDKEKYFQSQDNIEVFLKGFFEVILDLEERYNITFLAFVGMEMRHIKILRDICIAFSPRKFPQNVQLYVGEKNCVDNLLLFGTNYHQVIRNGYLTSIEHGSKIINTLDYIRANSLLNKLLMTSEEQKYNMTQIVPFDVLLPCNKEENCKIFDKRVKALADNDIDGEDAGFLIRNTHMRLGSKVHIQSFYEMSFLFYRTSIANRIAFEILHDLYLQAQDGILDINQDRIVFYGYASYSKAILTSLVEMLRIYRKMNGGEYKEVSFVSYQHNLQSESEEIKMYFGFGEKFSACLKDDKVYSDEKIKVVQVVPIGSTLTTFEKMWSQFKKSLHDDAKDKFVLSNNYTVFWVLNADKSDLQAPSKIEEEYWSRTNLKDRVVETKFKEFQNSNSNLIRYFVHCPVNWQHPLACDLCYPSSVIDEIPLVETDQTSTVPTQQIRKYKSSKKSDSTVDEQSINERLRKLKGCVSYGHIVREQNHFQYYVDTQAYFYRVKEQVQEWLENCNRETESEFPVMHIIFSPEHNTNVGFAQYVNTYYFGGIAEIVSINEDKEFRSNFECEHAALIQTINDLHKYVEVNSFEEMPVKFYYVDDTIISGETFQKANSFLRTLLPSSYRNRYGTNLISKCFLLIDRMSNETKRNYVRDTNNDFYSFLHIDISNMRTQGDSCVGCKLKQDATRLFKRSATYKMEKYWADKIKNNEKVQYDNKKEIVRYQTDDAYEKMIISHIAQNLIFINNDSFEIGNTYDVILTLAFDLLGKKKKINNVNHCFKDLIKDFRGIHGLSIFLKIISRPFFSFDFKIKMQVLTLIIILTEVLIGNGEQVKAYKGCLSNDLKLFLLEENRLNYTIQLGEEIGKIINGEDKLKFLKDVLMESITDMKSTYLLRIESIKSMYHFLTGYETENQEDFWNNYARNIHRIVDCSSDEMRSLNLEYLLLTGMEYKEFSNENTSGDFKPIFLYKAITGKEKPDKRDPFFIFCHELLFQNNRIMFDGIEKELAREESEDTYYMAQWRNFRCLETFKVYDKEKNQELPSNNEKDLFTYLKNPNASNSKGQVNERYVEWMSKICEMFKKKYDFGKEEIKTCLLTWTKEDDDNAAKIGELDILTEINLSDSINKFDAKEKIVKALNCEKNNSNYYLKDDGYMISENESTSYFILYFNNSNVDVKTDIKRSLKPIAKVFLFFEITNKRENNFFILRFMLRDIMVYRNRIMRMLESDFEGDMFTKYAHTIGEKNIIAHEKASSHSNSYDDENVLNFLLNQSAHIKYENLDSSQAAKWLIMRNYVNEQIAKLFNRSFQETNSALKGNKAESPSLYLDDKVKLYMNESLYNNKLECFQDLNLIMDYRFILLESIINIKYTKIFNKKFIVRDGLGYNAEFFKCVLIDIIFSAIKYQADKYEFLLQINHLLNVKKLYRNDGLINQDSLSVQCEEYKIEIFVEPAIHENFDYLVIENPIYKIINDYEYMNEEIRKKMEDPLDFADGHLSLLTIKRYIEGLSNDLVGKCKFEYYMKPEDGLWFRTKLPVIRKEEA